MLQIISLQCSFPIREPSELKELTEMVELTDLTEQTELTEVTEMKELDANFREDAESWLKLRNFMTTNANSLIKSTSL